MNHQMHDKLAYDKHIFLAARLRENPHLLQKVKEFHEDILKVGLAYSRRYYDAWSKAISEGVEAVIALVSDPGDQGQVIRSCSSFSPLWESYLEKLHFIRDWRLKHGQTTKVFDKMIEENNPNKFMEMFQKTYEESKNCTWNK